MDSSIGVLRFGQGQARAHFSQGEGRGRLTLNSSSIRGNTFSFNDARAGRSPTDRRRDLVANRP